MSDHGTHQAHDHGHPEPSFDTHGDDHHDHGGTGKYWVVFVLLCVLTSASFLTFFPFWRENVSVEVSRTFMMAVSCMKALLVMAFFMHLIWEANWKYVLTIPAAMMSVFLVLMLVPDIGCRYQKYAEERLLHAAEPHEEAHGHHGPETITVEGHEKSAH